MVWRESKDHIMDCYFYMINIKKIRKYCVKYFDIPFAPRPISHGPDLPFPEPDGNMEYSSNSEHSDITIVARDDAEKPKEDD